MYYFTFHNINEKNYMLNKLTTCATIYFQVRPCSCVTDLQINQCVLGCLLSPVTLF